MFVKEERDCKFRRTYRTPLLAFSKIRNAFTVPMHRKNRSSVARVLKAKWSELLDFESISHPSKRRNVRQDLLI